MPTPDFILELRRHVGTMPLSLSGVTAVVLRGDEVLLGRRSDTGALTPITGIVDPQEEPADAAVRETLEETGIRVDGAAPLTEPQGGKKQRQRGQEEKEGKNGKWGHFESSSFSRASARAT